MLLKMGQGHTGVLRLCAAVRGGLLTSVRPLQRAWMSRESAPRLMIGFDEFVIAAGKCFLNTATARASSSRSSSALAVFEAMFLFLDSRAVFALTRSNV